MCDAEKMWNALVANEDFSQSIQGLAQEVFRVNLVDRIPELLEKHLDEPVSLASLLAVKIEVGEFVLSSELIDKVMPYMPKEDILEDGIEYHMQMVRDDLRERLDGFRVLAGRNRSLVQVLHSSEAGLLDPIDSFKSLYRKGVELEKLTIRSLLEQYPMLVLE